MLDFIPFCIKLLDSEDISGCPKNSPRNRGYILSLCIYLFICALIYLFEIASEYKSRPNFDKQSLFHSKGSVLLAVFQMGIKLFTAINTRKIQMNSKIGSLLLYYGRSTRSAFISERVSGLMLAVKAQSHLASDTFKTWDIVCLFLFRSL